MKYLLLMTLFVSCGRHYSEPTETIALDDQLKVTKPLSCTVVRTDVGATITCPDGSTVDLTNGQVGEAGTPGVNGTNCSATQTLTGADITCGEVTVSIANGQDGESIQGPQGVAGTSSIAISSVITTGRAALPQCTSGEGMVIATQIGKDNDGDNILDEILDNTVSFVCDGARGETGSAGQNGTNGVTTEIITYRPMQIINPCNATTVVTNEIFLKLDETTIVAVYYTGSSSHLSVLSPGTYVTTGVTGNCTFQVTSDFQIVR